MGISSYPPGARYTIDESNQSASRVPLVKVNFRTYRVVAGDTMDRIAHRVFGDFNRWWEIADMNPHIKFPLALEEGQVLRIPL